MGRLLQWLHSHAGTNIGTRIEDFDAEAVRETVRQVGALFGGPRSYFPLEITGFDTVPEGPALFVSNHSGGTSIPDAWGLMISWYRHFGVGRPMHVLAHDMVFSLRATGEPFARRGVLRARRDLALKVLTEWNRDLVVWPGGDLDTWRPYSERYKVRFSGRKGYAKLAIQAGRPIVPVAHAGSHETLVVLTDGQRLAQRLHFPELFRASIFPIHLSFPYGLGIGPLPHLPTPVALRYRLARPIWPERQCDDPTQEEIDALDERVRAAMQHELDVLAATAPRRGERLRAVARRLRQTRVAAPHLSELVDVVALAAK